MSDSIDTRFPLDFPALNGRPVTQRHANYCAEHGHATHTNDGVVAPWCPRCGENLPTDPAVKTSRVDPALVVRLRLAAQHATSNAALTSNAERRSMYERQAALFTEAANALVEADAIMLGITR